MDLLEAVTPTAAGTPRRKHRRTRPAGARLDESTRPVSLSDAGAASDALEHSAELGELPELAPINLSDRTHSPKRKAGTKSTRASVTAKQLAEPIQGLLGLATFAGALLLCGFALEDPAVDSLVMEAEEAEAIATPLANILMRQAWFMQYAGTLAGSQDAIALVFAVLLYVGRIAPTVRAKLGTRQGGTRASEKTSRIPAQEPNEPVSLGGWIPGGAYAVS
jgi:hypothetical protein